MSFISTFSKLALVLSIMACAIGLLNGVLLLGMMTPEQLRPTEGDHGATLFIAQHLRGFVIVFILYWVVGLAASIGLLKRQRWAKRVWQALLIAAIAWSIAAPVLEFVLPAEQGGGVSLQPFQPSSLIVVVTGLLATLLLGWLLKRLASEAP